MIVNMYSVRDNLTGYGYPFVQPNDDAALRNFKFLLTRESGSEFSVKPDDYSLYRVCRFDTDTGSICDSDLCAIARKDT